MNGTYSGLNYAYIAFLRLSARFTGYLPQGLHRNGQNDNRVVLDNSTNLTKVTLFPPYYCQLRKGYALLQISRFQNHKEGLNLDRYPSLFRDDSGPPGLPRVCEGNG